MVLTERQKAENKAARKVRDRAYAARKKELYQAQTAAELSELVIQARQRLREAQQFAEALDRERNIKIDSLRVQIQSIEKEITLLQESERNDRAHKNVSHFAEVWRKTLAAEKAVVEARFPDLQGSARWAVGCWNIPPDVRAEMDAARAAAASEFENPIKELVTDI